MRWPWAKTLPIDMAREIWYNLTTPEPDAWEAQLKMFYGAMLTILIVHSPFSGLIVCAHCGKHFERHTENAGTKYSKPAWSCLTSVKFGKEYCPMGQKLPEDILKQKTCEALGLEGLDESIVREQIKEIIVPKAFTLIYVFKNGTEKEVAWQHRSRRESWTPEMKEAARQRTIAQHEAKKRKGDSNGS